MENKLFPKEIIENTAEANFSKHSTKSKFIYLTVIFALVAFFIVLPLIQVNVSVRSAGVIKSITDKNQLTSLVSGKIDKLFIDENSTVKRGEIVAKISDPLLQGKAQYNADRTHRIQGYLSDISKLLNLKSSDFFNADEKQEAAGSQGSETHGSNVKPSNILTNFEGQIHTAALNVKKAYQQSNKMLNINNLAGETADLSTARSYLKQLLSDNSFNLVTSKLSANQEANKQALSQFQQQIKDILGKIEKAHKGLEHHLLLYKQDIVTVSMLKKSRVKLHQAWTQLLAKLEGDLFNIAAGSPGKQKVMTISVPSLNLQTAKYRSSLLRLKQKANNALQKVKLNRQKFKRKKTLYHKNLISKATYQKSKFDFENAKSQLKLIIYQQKTDWSGEQVTYEQKLKEVQNKYQNIRQKTEKYVIRAPVSGSIQNMKGVYEGGYITANEPFAVISPDTALVAMCYVSPKDIGLIRKGMKVRFQVSAFDYNQWGLLTGTVREVSNDVTVINDKPAFKVRSSLDHTWLELKNGYRGHLKKGMTLQARFKITKRSLFQLLYDKLDDWLNPTWDDPKGQTHTPVQASN